MALIYNGSGTLTDRILNGPGENNALADENASGTVSWLLGDNEGTIRDVVQFNSGTNTTTIVDHLKYDSFGNITAQSNGADQPLFAYTGQMWDAAAGLYYDHARWYDPHDGRFISQDPTGFAAGDPNLYRYVTNSPTNLIDPTGTDGMNSGAATAAAEQEMQQAQQQAQQAAAQQAANNGPDSPGTAPQGASGAATGPDAQALAQMGAQQQAVNGAGIAAKRLAAYLARINAAFGKSRTGNSADATVHDSPLLRGGTSFTIQVKNAAGDPVMAMQLHFDENGNLVRMQVSYMETPALPNGGGVQVNYGPKTGKPTGGTIRWGDGNPPTQHFGGPSGFPTYMPARPKPGAPEPISGTGTPKKGEGETDVELSIPVPGGGELTVGGTVESGGTPTTGGIGLGKSFSGPNGDPTRVPTAWPPPFGPPSPKEKK